MLSYDWSLQKMVIQVRDALAARGVKTWMVRDQRSNSQTLAREIENPMCVHTCFVRISTVE